EAHQRLREAFHRVGEPLLEERVTEIPPFRRPELRYLVENSFLPPSSSSDTPSAGDSLVLIEAPDPAQEVGAVLRRVKRLLLSKDCQPDDILIAVRDWPRYAGHFAALGRTYQ